MLDNKGFDLWAEGYDKSVGLSDDDNSYPFAQVCLLFQIKGEPMRKKWRKKNI